MRVALLGANGFIGPHIADALLARGCEVIAVSRTGSMPARRGIQSIATDRSDPRALRAAIEKSGARRVVDLLAMDVESTRPLLEALSGAIERLVLASSGDVYGNYDAIRRHVGAEPSQGPLGEDSALRTRLYPYSTNPARSHDDPLAWMDRYDKIPVEAALRAQQGFDWTILRLPMVFGPKDRQRRFSWAVRPMQGGVESMELDGRWAAWRTTYGYVEDVGAAIALAATHDAARNRVYNVGRPDAPSHLDWAMKVACAMNWHGEVRTVDRSKVQAQLAAQLDAMDLTVPMVMDTGRIRRELGFAEPTSEEDALARTIADELARSRPL